MINLRQVCHVGPQVECAEGKYCVITDELSAATSRFSSWRSSGTRATGVHLSGIRTRCIPDGGQVVLVNTRSTPRKRPPEMSYFSSNHIMVNTERAKQNIEPLARRMDLDELARKRASEMAVMDSLGHGHTRDLEEMFEEPCQRIGQNIACGPSTREIHSRMVLNSGSRNNMIDRRYKFFGVGTAKAKSGTLYLCQIFGG